MPAEGGPTDARAGARAAGSASACGRYAGAQGSRTGGPLSTSPTRFVTRAVRASCWCLDLDLFVAIGASIYS